ncbi:ABC transporter permease [Polymorphum gilvum]|uniref:ATP-binding cassette (ABC) superfamily transporter, permease component n=1 Tax=Polymorphum gilvum (strain LMG 25793 / CGMCC 1.9160 / SL003B-26A1) TaxID=991905 RepID=F2IYV0_POLGS|nr:ABC transporter permease [Polymorphum gilvum]ADZ70565.1 ATP-binding cassette (ABC) superfamily transporter, permease component [Polymorphum gilvum SL003B-26A1]
MSLEGAAGDIPALAGPARASQGKTLRSLGFAGLGMVLLMVLWWVGGVLVERNPNTVAFAGFAPVPALSRLADMVASGEAWAMIVPSLERVLGGLAVAIAIGVPLGILVGRVPMLREITNIPFQFLRMISPLSWMPIAVMAFPTWDGAIVFLIAIAALWPVLFATAAGLKRVDPAWFKVARNLGARPWHMLFLIILPAISQDILTGIRLALGVAWIVLVPAEYLGVTSGLGYAINDARDTLEYDRLAATVVIIGAIGFGLDFLCQQAIARLSWHRED